MKDHETQKDGAQGQPPLKAKTGGGQERQHKHADAHPPARPDVLGEHFEQLTLPLGSDDEGDVVFAQQRDELGRDERRGAPLERGAPRPLAGVDGTIGPNAGGSGWPSRRAAIASARSLTALAYIWLRL